MRPELQPLRLLGGEMPRGSYWSWLLLWLREISFSLNIHEEVVQQEINDLFITGHLQRPDHNPINLSTGSYIF